MIITVNTDASFHPRYKVGGYAFWISTNVGRFQGSGPLKNIKRDRPRELPMEAELQCIANALHYTISIRLPNVHKIIINCDCQFAFNEVRKKAPVGSTGRVIYNQLRELRRMYNIEGRPIHEFRYVKAHNGTPDARSFVNDWCDKEAKKHMRSQLPPLPPQTNTDALQLQQVPA